MKMSIRKMALLYLGLVSLFVSGCQPTVHLTGEYNPQTGDIVAGVDVTFKDVMVEIAPGVWEKRTIRVPRGTPVRTISQ